jgi:hypothetical protein
MSILGVITPNFYKQSRLARPHNKEKLVNECLASHQLVYVSYYFTMLLLTNHKFNEVIERMISGLMILSIIFFIAGHYMASHQDQKLKRYHVCASRNNCNVDLPMKTQWKVYGANLILAIISFTAAILCALNPALIKTS